MDLVKSLPIDVWRYCISKRLTTREKGKLRLSCKFFGRSVLFNCNPDVWCYTVTYDYICERSINIGYKVDAVPYCVIFREWDVGSIGWGRFLGYAESSKRRLWNENYPIQELPKLPDGVKIIILDKCKSNILDDHRIPLSRGRYEKVQKMHKGPRRWITLKDYTTENIHNLLPKSGSILVLVRYGCVHTYKTAYYDSDFDLLKRVYSKDGKSGKRHVGVLFDRFYSKPEHQSTLCDYLHVSFSSRVSYGFREITIALYNLPFSYSYSMDEAETMKTLNSIGPSVLEGERRAILDALPNDQRSQMCGITRVFNVILYLTKFDGRFIDHKLYSCSMFAWIINNIDHCYCNSNGKSSCLPNNHDDVARFLMTKGHDSVICALFSVPDSILRFLRENVTFVKMDEGITCCEYSKRVNGHIKHMHFQKNS